MNTQKNCTTSKKGNIKKQSTVILDMPCYVWMKIFGKAGVFNSNKHQPCNLHVET